jgi:hypothetical protein
LNDEKWYYLLEEIERKFGIEEKNTEEVPEKKIVVETAIFKGVGGKMKLERTSRAVILERQVKFSRRIGGGSDEKYLYSDKEKSYRVALYKWDEVSGAWQEIELRKLGA